MLTGTTVPWFPKSQKSECSKKNLSNHGETDMSKGFGRVLSDVLDIIISAALSSALKRTHNVWVGKPSSEKQERSYRWKSISLFDGIIAPSCCASPWLSISSGLICLRVYIKTLPSRRHIGQRVTTSAGLT
jgi:hypothetical protein